MSEELKQEQKRIEDALIPVNLTYYEIADINDLTVEIKIEGDWKHDHGLCRHIMDGLGYLQVGEVAEESDDDWYTSTHIFMKADENKIRQRLDEIKKSI